MSADFSRTQARRMTETAYMAASTGLLWVAIYYLPIGDALFRLAIPLPLVLLQLRHGGRTALEGVAVTVLLVLFLLKEPLGINQIVDRILRAANRWPFARG